MILVLTEESEQSEFWIGKMRVGAEVFQKRSNFKDNI